MLYLFRGGVGEAVKKTCILHLQKLRTLVASPGGIEDGAGH